MQVFTLMGGYDYEGETLVGVFGSEQSVRKHVQSKTWYYDSMSFVVSETGQPVDLTTVGQSVSFTRYNGEIVKA